MTAWTLWAGLPFVVLVGAPDLVRTDWSAVSLQAWIGVVYAGVFAIGLAYLLWYRGVRIIGQNRTAVYQNLVPVVALVSAWLWLAETPTPQQLAGAGVILSGVIIARRSKGGTPIVTSQLDRPMTGDEIPDLEATCRTESC